MWNTVLFCESSGMLLPEKVSHLHRHFFTVY